MSPQLLHGSVSCVSRAYRLRVGVGQMDPGLVVCISKYVAAVDSGVEEQPNLGPGIRPTREARAIVVEEPEAEYRASTDDLIVA